MLMCVGTIRESHRKVWSCFLSLSKGLEKKLVDMVGYVRNWLGEERSHFFVKGDSIMQGKP